AELSQWLSAFKYHINSVWEGIEKGVFNPARGRGGATAEQKQIVAAYMLGKIMKKKVLNERHQEYMNKKYAIFRQYERLAKPFVIPSTSPLGELFGLKQNVSFAAAQPDTVQESVTSGLLHEVRITTVGDWSRVIQWLCWQFFMAK